MVNPGEVLLKAVMFDKPGVVPWYRTLKLLLGLNQSGMWPGVGASAFPCRRCCATGREARPNPPGSVSGTW
jgi:hypothetical protein